VAEGGGLLNRYTLQRRIEGSNPSGSAILLRAGALRRTSAGLERADALCASLKILQSNSFVDECMSRSRSLDLRDWTARK
jgi:hypothetical protein